MATISTAANLLSNSVGSNAVGLRQCGRKRSGRQDSRRLQTNGPAAAGAMMIASVAARPWTWKLSETGAFLTASGQHGAQAGFSRDVRQELASPLLVATPRAHSAQQSFSFPTATAAAAAVAGFMALGSSMRRASSSGLAFGVRSKADGQRRLVNVLRKGLQTGIVGLPNVGKSTLFNALCDKGVAEAANYPFCTIDPNMGAAKVVDKRLDTLAGLANSKKVIPEFIEYVDIAGLVRGASKGEGLGNKFLGNIRTTDAIVHVVRCFEDEDITHVDGSVDPARDIETITLELVFSDMDQIEKRLKKVEKDIVGKKEGAKEEKEALLKILPLLEQGKAARTVELTEKEIEAVKGLQLLTMKKVIYAANVSEEELSTGNEYVEIVKKIAEESGDKAVVVSAAVEAELNTLEGEDRAEYLETLGVEESGCETLVRETFKLLGLRTYFTVGPEEARAWTIREGWLAPQAAGVIHTDFEKGFIKAETVAYDDYVACGSEEEAKAKGVLRIEGKEYVVQEADVMHFRFNV